MVRFIFGVLLLATSCTSSFDPLQSDIWELDSVYGYMIQVEQEASELDFSERVQFVADGLFLKFYTRDGETTIFEGRWIETERDGRTGYLVTYTEDHVLIRNCFAEPEEFYFRSQGLLIQSDFTPCDGPEYRYVRVSE